MENPLISVIIPVYKVEEYLERCVRSVQKQTLRDIEILLIDDGSPDRCPEMCDAFAEEDDRIRVIHTDNKGIADTRNLGLDEAKAGLITFVDSDDFVEEQMCEDLYNLLIGQKADVAVGGIADVYKEGVLKEEPGQQIRSFTGKEALSEILQGRIISGSPCCKLFKKSLFSGYRFPVGLTYEDAYLIPEILLDAERVAVTTKRYYAYWHRPGSLTTAPFTEQAMDVITAYDHIYQAVKEKCPEKLPEARFRVLWAHFVVLDRMLFLENPEKLPQYSEVVGFLKKNWKEIRRCEYFEKTRRLSAVAIKMGVPFYRILWRIHEKRIEVNASEAAAA